MRLLAFHGLPQIDRDDALGGACNLPNTLIENELAAVVLEDAGFGQAMQETVN